MNRTLTKSLGILTLILIFALSSSAQRRVVKTKLIGGGILPGAGTAVELEMEYHRYSKKLTFKVIKGDYAELASVAVTRLGSSNIKLLKKNYDTQIYTKYMSSLGLTTAGLHRIVVVDSFGKVTSMNFFVN